MKELLALAHSRSPLRSCPPLEGAVRRLTRSAVTRQGGNFLAFFLGPSDLPEPIFSRKPDAERSGRSDFSSASLSINFHDGRLAPAPRQVLAREKMGRCENGAPAFRDRVVCTCSLVCARSYLRIVANGTI
jgi:hypothetical protein